MSDESYTDAGYRLRRLVLGDTYADGVEALHRPGLAEAAEPAESSASSRIAHEFHTLSSPHAWGSYWPRPGLDLLAREVATLGVLIVQANEHELGLHFQGMLRNELATFEQLEELLVHAVDEAGFAPVERAFGVLDRIPR
jgi:alkylhydroperoxidase/carboxymuconolactone decarboxylase family protein YurZ